MAISHNASSDSNKSLPVKNNKQADLATSNASETDVKDLFGVRRLIADPRKITPDNILSLQRKIGNQAVMRLLQKKGSGPAQIQRHPGHSEGSHGRDEEEETTTISQVTRLYSPKNGGKEEPTPEYQTALTPLPTFEEENAAPETGEHPVARLWDRAELTTIAGVPTIGASKYNAILKKLDAYHTKAQKLWGKGRKSETFKNQFNKLLDELVKVTWAYVENFDTSAQVPALRKLVSEEVPAERKLIAAVANKEDFATTDRNKTVGEVKDGQPARVIDAGINISETTVYDTQEAGTAQSHAMDLWIDVDAGKEPIKPENAPPNSVYGVSIEYWENVEIPYNFVAKPTDNPVLMKQNGVGSAEKPWNDILAIRPDASTFSTANQPIQVSWTSAVNQAQTRTLRGRNIIGFTDKPGVTPKPDKYIERILRFRIVIKDSTKQREIYATQKFKLDGQLEPVYKTYVDSKGNKIGKERDAVNQNQHNPIANHDPRLQSHDVTEQVLERSIPNSARAKVKDFVAQLLAKNPNPAPTPFNFIEKNEIETHFQDKVTALSQFRNISALGNKKYNAPDNTMDSYYAIQGMNLLPFPDSGQNYYQFALQGGGLLVAILSGDTIQKMYYTDNQSRPVTTKNINVRSYAEVPMDEVEPYARQQKYMGSLTNSEKVAFNSTEQAKNNELITQAQSVLNINGALVSDNATINYVLAHPEQYDLIEKEYNTTKTPLLFSAALLTYYQGQITANGTGANEYIRLYNLISNPKAWKVLRDAFIAKLVSTGAAGNNTVAGTQVDQYFNNNRANLGSTPALTIILNTNANQNNKTNLENAVMNYIKTNKNKVGLVENDYNTLVPTLNLPGVHQTLGELANNFFTRAFKTRGKEVDVFAELIADYPDFRYRIVPAYRRLFGDVQLKNITTQMQKAHAAAEVPNPGSLLNIRAKRAFRNHGPFTQTDFTTSIHNAAKFDTTYDPATNELKITVRLSFDFQDNTSNAPVQPQGKEVGSQYSSQNWTNQGKADFKRDFKDSILGKWNRETHPIKCVKPGWEDIMANPVFDIQEVGVGTNEHNKVTTSKANLTMVNSPGMNKKTKQMEFQSVKQLKGAGTSAWGAAGTGLKEFDVADKVSDPTVHKYLHQGERSGNIAPAYTTDRSRIDTRLKDFGSIQFGAGSSTSLDKPEAAKILADELKRLAMPPDIAGLHPLLLEGSVSGKPNKSLSTKRAKYVEKLLREEGIKNPIKVGVGANHFDGVTVKNGPEDPKVVDTYVSKWSRISAAHEFGHMLGLMDEYYGAKSESVVKKMISDGLLPPETRGDHLTAHPPTQNVNEASGQEATMKLLEANDLSSPDFTMSDNAKSTSLMTGGYEVWSQHFVTVWEALANLTSAHIDSKYWKIS